MVFWFLALLLSTLFGSPAEAGTARKEEGLPAGSFDACRSGGVRGGGYDSTTDRYAWTCYYPWTRSRGGGSGSYNTATNTGGVDSAYEVSCDGPYNPDPACVQSGEVLIVNADPNIALAMDYTKDGGTLWIPVPEGRESGLYVLSGCGEQADGTNNSCPFLRAPYDTFYAGSRIQTGIRGIKIALEGADVDGIRTVVDGTGRPRRTGVYLLLDSGSDSGGFDPGLNSATTRRKIIVGLGTGANRCTGTTEGVCGTPSGSTTVISANRTGGTSNFEILGDPQHGDLTWCVDDTTTGNLGVCSSGAQGTDTAYRYRCASDTDCTGVNAGWSCIGGATFLEEELAATPSGRVSWLCEAEYDDALGTDTGTSFSVEVTFESIDTGSGNCNSTGFPATLWSIENNGVFAARGAAITSCMPYPTEMLSEGVALTGGTISPANSWAYGFTAADIAGEFSCDSDHDGEVVAIIDDDGSCSATSGDLDGGGSTNNECICDFSGTGDWAQADCDTVPGSGGDGDKRGCVDDSSALAFSGSPGSIVERVHITGFYKDNSTPLVDIEGGVLNGASVLRDSVLDWNNARLSDTGRTVNYINNSFTSNDANDGTLFSAGFSGSGNVHRGNTFERNAASNIVACGECSGFTMLDTTFMANSVDNLFEVRNTADGVWIQGVYGQGNNGHLLTVQAFTDNDVFGPIVLRDVNLHMGTRPRESGGANDFIAPITFTDNLGNGDGATWLGPFVIDNVHVRTAAANAILVAFDGEPTAATGSGGSGTSTIDDMRSLVSITNSSISNQNYGGTAVLARLLDDNTGGENDATEGDNIFLSAHMPRMDNNWVNGVQAPSYPYSQVAASEAGDCTASPSGDGEVPPGTVMGIYDDATVNTCTDAGADGVLDGGGTDVKSVCVCTASGWASVQ